MFGPIPTYDPLVGDPLPLPMVGNSINGARNSNNMDNEPNDQTFEGMNRAALLAWQERQRRQRSLRTMMMLLMVLLLMDGDEPPNRHHHRTGRLRHQHGRHHGKGGEYWENLMIGDDGNLMSPLNPEVFRSRVEQDAAVRIAIRDNKRSRYHDLVRMNHGRDVEWDLRKWITNKLRNEIKKATLTVDLDGKNGAETSDDDSEDYHTKPPTAHRIKSSSKQRLEQEEILLDDEMPQYLKELNDAALFHYPCNATGYYRGLWIRTATNKTMRDSSSSMEYNEKLESSAESEEDENFPPGNVTSEEVRTWAQDKLRQRGDDVGIFFLPPDVYIEPDATMVTKNSSLGDTLISIEEPITLTTTTTPSNSHHSLSLTKEAGRAAFQLYSRPIPVMNELSIVDGLVKLYDGTTTSFVAQRTDVLLRVRGVIIHGIGKLSLVTSSWSASDGGVAMGKRRSFLGIRQVEEAPRRRKFVEPDDNGKYDDFDASDDENERRRSLREIIENLHSWSDHQDAQKSIDKTNKVVGSRDRDATITQIRDEVVDLYSLLFINDDVYNLNNKNEMKQTIENDGWTRLQSVDEDYFDDSYDGISDSIVENYTNDGDDEIIDHIAYSHTPSERKLHDITNDDVVIEVGDFALGNGGNTRAGSGNRVLTDSTVMKNSSMNASSSFGIAIDGLNNDWRRSTLALLSAEERTVPTRYIYPYPYVIDDADDSIKKASFSATRKIPSREQVSQANAANCEFEINMDIQEIKWTYDEWQASMEHRLRMEGFFHPNWNIAQSKTAKLERSQYLFPTKSKFEFKEALVMIMVGAIESNDCDFHSFVNVTAMRTNWEHTTAKAINYSFYMMLTCLTQIVILLRQLLHTQSQSIASNVSLLCIGWQALLDAILCISHIFLCLVMQPLFTAFASVAFFKLLIFCVIEMKYMAIIIHARNNANNSGVTQEDLRRQITMLHLKFYGALMSSILAFWFFGQTNRSLYILLLYSFWVPQIILNIITESRKPLHPYYLYGMSLTRSVAPIYVFAYRYNFLKEVNPDFPTDTRMCELLIVWIGLQTAILYAQSKYGTRFMIPQRFLPPKFDYSRPIPSTLLPRLANNPSNGTTSGIELMPLLTGDASPARNGVARNRRGGGNRARLGSRAEDMECPICRCNLPSI
ncbi:hypothetical protein ACHAXA_003396 [Cyclostephanos tholiformis]|uniref:RING-type E3 ubiquitin transferase n=1 Tax=Cyclostephanos tholiformis TaxID=382380 RepID=A0ABD3RD57_9STRA